MRQPRARSYPGAVASTFGVSQHHESRHQTNRTFCPAEHSLRFGVRALDTQLPRRKTCGVPRAGATYGPAAVVKSVLIMSGAPTIPITHSLASFAPHSTKRTTAEVSTGSTEFSSRKPLPAAALTSWGRTPTEARSNTTTTGTDPGTDQGDWGHWPLGDTGAMTSAHAPECDGFEYAALPVKYAAFRKPLCVPVIMGGCAPPVR